MTWAGPAALAVFVGGVVASLRGWIPQRVVTLQALLLVVAGLALGFTALAGQPIPWPQLFAAANVHPVTSVIAGFLLAGALHAAGAFDAAARLLGRLTRTRLGAPFVILLVVNLPTILAMPCGRILVSPLMPLALMLGWALARERREPVLVAVTVFGLVVNAAASCGPSVIGGIGMLGEGMGRYPPGSFSNPAQVAILVITVATMALIRWGYGGKLRMRATPPAAVERTVPEHGYLALAMFVAVLLLVVLVRPPVPLQVTLTLGTVCVMLVARLGLDDLLGGVMIHPLSAMLAGFVVAGALSIAGAFDALLALLVWAAEHTWLGYVGMSVVLAYVPVMLAMPCGRIVSLALIPGVLLFGVRLAGVTGLESATPALLSAFILAGAASCGPSAIGGIGSIGEGRLRIRDAWSGQPQTFGIFLGVPVTALLVARLPLTSTALDGRYFPVALAVGAIAGAVVNLVYGYRVHHLGGLLGGLLTGALLVIL